MGEGEDTTPLVREGTLELKLKVLEQRITIKLIAGLLATQALAHFSIPSSVTATAFLAFVAKLAIGARW